MKYNWIDESIHVKHYYRTSDGKVLGTVWQFVNNNIIWCSKILEDTFDRHWAGAFFRLFRRVEGRGGSSAAGGYGGDRGLDDAGFLDRIDGDGRQYI